MQLFKTILYNFLANSGNWNFSKTMNLVNNYFYELNFRDSSNFTSNNSLKKDFSVTEIPKVASNSFIIKLPNNYYCSDTTEFVFLNSCEIGCKKDYYPFGMVMPGRSFSSNQYRYGFNGMEKDDELKGSGNSYDFGARLYDPRLGKWLALDPLMKKYPGITPYAFVANSPIYWLDKEGKDLWIGKGRENAISDVKSIIPNRYHSLIKVFDDGEVRFDVKGLSQAEINSDAGLTLLNDMVNKSDKKYLYEASEDKSGSIQSGVQNKSVTPVIWGSEIPDNVPEGFDASVLIDPDCKHFDNVNGVLEEMPRSGVVFHELQGSFERTDNELPYMFKLRVIINGKSETIENPFMDGAHTTASKKASKLHKNAKKPEGTKREGDYKKSTNVKTEEAK